MGSNGEQMDLVSESGMDGVAYILILYSLAFMAFLFITVLISVYDCAMAPDSPDKEVPEGRLGPRLNGAVPVRDAQEFELEGLMSDDDDDDTPGSKGRASLDAPNGEIKAGNGNAR